MKSVWLSLLTAIHSLLTAIHPPAARIYCSSAPTAWIIVGDSGGGLHCSDRGCVGTDAYWTGETWSLNWKAAKLYPAVDGLNYVIPNGKHCCYSETPTLVDPSNSALSSPLVTCTVYAAHDQRQHVLIPYDAAGKPLHTGLPFSCPPRPAGETRREGDRCRFEFSPPSMPGKIEVDGVVISLKRTNR